MKKIFLKVAVVILAASLLPSKAFSSLANMVVLEISGPGMNTMSTEFPASNSSGKISGVPAGSNRTLTIKRYDSNENLVYTGTKTITVTAGSTLSVSLYDGGIEVTSAETVTPMLAGGGGIYDAISESHSLALKNNGTIRVFGSNTKGQLGDGSLALSATPVTTRLMAAKAVSGGTEHSIAMRFDGTVWSWGDNSEGQLGNGTSGAGEYENVPVQVVDSLNQPFSNVTAVAAGDYFNVALKSDGTVWGWGFNFYGQIGNNTEVDSEKPVQTIDASFQPFSSVKAIAAGFDHTVALKRDGTVWAWGLNDDGQIGDGTSGGKRLTPVQAVGEGGSGNITAISAGGYSTIALKNDGTVWAWGNTDFGQIGNGTVGDGNPLTPDPQSTPVQVSGLTGITAIVAGGSHAVALKSEGTVWTWGNNIFGQLCNAKSGDGDTTTVDPGDYEATPVQVCAAGETDPCTNFITDIIAIAAGFRHTLLMKSDGTVWSCGWNEYGQLGDGTYGSGNISSVPVQVLNLDLSN